MNEFYGVEPYHLYFVEYIGYRKFKLEIFNVYVVEIRYPLRMVPTKKPRISGQSAGYVSSSRMKFSEIVVSKLHATLCFNALYNSGAYFNLMILKEHVEDAVLIPVCVLVICVIFLKC